MNIIPQALLQISPGIIGVAVSKLFSGDSKDKPANNTTIKYFLFTIASYICTFLTSLVTEILLKQPGLAEYNVLVAIIFAVLLGGLWPLYLRNILVSLANKINQVSNKNLIFLEEHILEKITKDNKPHYLKIIHANTEIASGWLENYQDKENSLSLRHLDNYPEKDLKEYRTIIYLDKSISIKEYK